MNLVLALLMHVIKQYIGEINYNNPENPEKSFLEKTIKNWFKSLDHVYETDIKKLESIVTSYHLNIFYHTLKIIFYRHQSTSLVANSPKRLKIKALNISEGIGYNFTKYEPHEKRNYIILFQCCLNFIDRKNEIKENDNIEKNTIFEGNIFIYLFIHFILFYFYFNFYFFFK